MAVSARWYGLGMKAALNKEVDWDSDTVKVALATSSYAPSQAQDYFSDVTNEVSGTGYTAGGATLGSKTITFTAADSWAAAWAASTAYAVGDVVRPATGNGHLYRCIVAGTAGGSAPTWPTVAGQTVTDGTVTWAEVGVGALVLDAADTSWPSSTLTARYAVIYVSTGTASTSALLGYVDFGADKISDSGTFAITWASAGILRLFVGA